MIVMSSADPEQSSLWDLSSIPLLQILAMLRTLPLYGLALERCPRRFFDTASTG